MAQPQKLTERNDEAAQVSLQMVKTMVAKTFDMRKIREQIVIQKRKEIAKVDRKYSGDLSRIDKDIYNFENAIKTLASAKEFYALKKEHKESIRLAKLEGKEEPKELEELPTLEPEEPEGEDPVHLEETGQELDEDGPEEV